MPVCLFDLLHLLIVEIQLIILFFVIAFVYSSVGFGGGSSYLAILALFDINYLSLRLIALLCNITVVSGSVLIFHRQGLLDWKKIWPILIFSVPAAFIGGFLEIGERSFFILLGFTLLIASIAMFFQSMIKKDYDNKPTSKLINGSIGGGIGFLSGIVGIGGGIFLSPTLHMLRWDKSIVIAATASTYILANSIAGLAGQLSRISFAEINISLLISLILAVLIGGQLGVRIGIFKFSPSILKKITAVLVGIVAIRILFEYVTL